MNFIWFGLLEGLFFGSIHEPETNHMVGGTLQNDKRLRKLFALSRKKEKTKQEINHQNDIMNTIRKQLDTGKMYPHDVIHHATARWTNGNRRNQLAKYDDVFKMAVGEFNFPLVKLLLQYDADPDYSLSEQLKIDGIVESSWKRYEVDKQSMHGHDSANEFVDRELQQLQKRKHKNKHDVQKLKKLKKLKTMFQERKTQIRQEDRTAVVWSLKKKNMYLETAPIYKRIIGYMEE